MFTFHCDLDNTLIYSYKHSIGEDKKCVELYQGKEISFMTIKSYELLRKISKELLFVPTTTRTIEQYRRIDLGIKEPKYALVCNGGILLKNGERDKEWYKESLNLISDCNIELKKAELILERDKNRCFENRNIEDLFLFTKSNNPIETVNILKYELNTDLVDVCLNGMKIYVLPKKLRKGSAIKRLRKHMNLNTVIAAGDSEFDISMLEEADIGMAPQQLKETFDLKGNEVIFQENLVFSDEILQHIEEFLLE